MNVKTNKTDALLDLGGHRGQSKHLARGFVTILGELLVTSQKVDFQNWVFQHTVSKKWGKQEE